MKKIIIFISILVYLNVASLSFSQEQNNTQNNTNTSGTNTNTGTSTNSNTVSGNYKSTYIAPPSVDAEVGTESGQITTLLGGVGYANTEAYIVNIEKLKIIQVMQKAGYLTTKEAKKEALMVFKNLKKSSCRDKILGFGPVSKSPLFKLLTFENCN